MGKQKKIKTLVGNKEPYQIKPGRNEGPLGGPLELYKKKKRGERRNAI